MGYDRRAENDERFDGMQRFRCFVNYRWLYMVVVMNRTAEVCVLLVIGVVAAFAVATASVKLTNDRLMTGAQLVIQSEHMNK